MGVSSSKELPPASEGPPDPRSVFESPDLLREIFRRVSMDSGKEALRCMEVCKQWKQEMKNSIVRLDLTNLRWSRYFIHGVLKSEFLTHLELHHCVVPESGWRSFPSCCPHLLSIHLENVQPSLSASNISLILAGRSNKLTDLHIIDSLHSDTLDLPDLVHMTSLQSLDLCHNAGLQSLPPLDALTSLSNLSLQNCSQLQILPGLANLTQLRTLDLESCRVLWPQEHLFGRMTSLERLSISSPILEPDTEWSCRQLRSLHHLSLSTANLHDLPSCEHFADTLFSLTLSKLSLTSIARLAIFLRLESLHIHACRDITDWDPINSLAKLQDLSISNCSHVAEITVKSSLLRLSSLTLISLELTQLSFDSTVPFDKLQRLSLKHCNHLKHIHNFSLLPALQYVKFFYCRSLDSVQGLEQLTSLKELYITECTQALASLGRLNSLYELHARWDTLGYMYHGASDFVPSLPSSLQSLRLNLQEDDPGSFPTLPSLKRIQLLLFASTSAERLAAFTSIESLTLSHCRLLRVLPELTVFPQLEDLKVECCPAILHFPSISSLPKLVNISIEDCNGMRRMSSIADLPSLRSLTIARCMSLKSLPPLPNLPSLRCLWLERCQKLQTLPEINHLTSLECISVLRCAKISSLPPLDGLTRLDTVYVDFGIRVHGAPAGIRINPVES